MIKTVIFDMDNTLIKCAEWHREALDEALRPYGYEISDALHHEVLNGLPTMKKLEILGVPIQYRAAIEADKQERFMAIARKRCKPVAKNIEAVRKLKEMGMTLAVASNSIRETVDLLLDLAGFQPFLSLTLSNCDVKEPKPSPEIYRLAMKRLRAIPEECLVVEDNFNGIRAAKASGAHVLEVESPEDVTFDHLIAAIRQYSMELTA